MKLKTFMAKRAKKLREQEQRRGRGIRRDPEKVRAVRDFDRRVVNVLIDVSKADTSGHPGASKYEGAACIRSTPSTSSRKQKCGVLVGGDTPRITMSRALTALSASLKSAK